MEGLRFTAEARSCVEKVIHRRGAEGAELRGEEQEKSKRRARELFLCTPLCSSAPSVVRRDCPNTVSGPVIAASSTICQRSRTRAFTSGATASSRCRTAETIVRFLHSLSDPCVLFRETCRQEQGRCHGQCHARRRERRDARRHRGETSRDPQRAEGWESHRGRAQAARRTGADDSLGQDRACGEEERQHLVAAHELELFNKCRSRCEDSKFQVQLPRSALRHVRGRIQIRNTPAAG